MRGAIAQHTVLKLSTHYSSRLLQPIYSVEENLETRFLTRMLRLDSIIKLHASVAPAHGAGVLAGCRLSSLQLDEHSQSLADQRTLRERMNHCQPASNLVAKKNTGLTSAPRTENRSWMTPYLAMRPRGHANSRHVQTENRARLRRLATGGTARYLLSQLVRRPSICGNRLDRDGCDGRAYRVRLVHGQFLR